MPPCTATGHVVSPCDARLFRVVDLERTIMKIKVVPQTRAMERLTPRLRPESNPGREPTMATKQKKSSGESREHHRSHESKREHAKPAEARSHGRDADDAQHDTSRGGRSRSDDKREHSSDREHRGGDARTGAAHSDGAENREHARKDESAERGQG